MGRLLLALGGHPAGTYNRQTLSQCNISTRYYHTHCLLRSVAIAGAATTSALSLPSTYGTAAASALDSGCWRCPLRPRSFAAMKRAESARVHDHRDLSAYLGSSRVG
jgi:hypothetical protein